VNPSLAPDPQWLAALVASADQPPLRLRVPLLWGQHVIGSVEPDYLNPQIQLQSASIGSLSGVIFKR